MLDSGKRDTFDSGSVRDTQDGKSRPELISPYFTERLGRWCALGAEKYADRNWELGQGFTRTMASLERHTLKYKKGLIDEDHLAAIAWNAMALIHYQEMIKLGLLPKQLNDMPRYEEKAAMRQHEAYTGTGLAELVQELKAIEPRAKEEDRRLRVYIAGPYTNPDPVANTNQAMEVWHRLWEMGLSPFCPHVSMFLHMQEPRPYQEWLDYDMDWLEVCDFVFRIPGESAGSDAETERAIDLGMPVVGGFGLSLEDRFEIVEKWLASEGA